MFRENDFVLRMVKELGALFQKVLGLRRARKFEEAMEALDGARQDLVSVPRAMLERMDSAGAAQLIADPMRIRAWARIQREEAEVLRDQGLDPNPRLTSAAETMLEAMSRSKPSDDDRTFVRELVAALPESAIAPRYAGQVAKLASA